MLSAISWVNRGQASDGFASAFAANAPAARAVVDAAITSWARLISNFNFDAGSTFVYEMTISMATTGTSNGARAGPTAFTTRGIPFRGDMTIGRGDDGPDVDVDVDGDGNPDKVGDGVGYFLDPTPFDSSEFTYFNNNAFAAYAFTGPAFGQDDLYEIVLHEMGHAVGLLPSTQMKALSTNTFNPDTIDSAKASPPVAPAIGNYWRFDGGEIKPLLTSYDSGGGVISPFDANGPQHFAPAGASVTIGGTTYRGADDLMTPYYASSQRRLISENDIGMLLHAYGYTTQHAGYYGTQYDTLDADGTLRIQTPGVRDDQVIVTFSPGIVTVNLALGSPVLGADPSTITSVFDSSAVSQIKINTGAGNDTISIGASVGINVSVNGGADIDTLIISGATGANQLNFISFTGGSHSFVSIGGVEDLTINGTAGDESFAVHSLPAHGNIRINPGNGGNSLILGDGDLMNDIGSVSSFLYGGGSGGDSVTLNNQNNATLNWADEVSGSAVGVFAAGYALFVGYSGVEAVTINGSQRNDQFTVLPLAPNTVTLNGNDGDDSFNIGGGNLLTSAGNAILNGGNGTDKLILDDSTSATTLPWAIRIDTIYLGINAFDYNNFERLEVFANGTANDFQIYGSVLPITLHGGDGNDQFRFLSSNTAALDITCDGQAGVDSMIVDDRNSVGGFAYTILTPTYLERNSPFTFDTVARYQNLESITYYAQSSAVTTYVYGTSAQIPAGQQYTLFLGNNADSVYIYAHDADGNLTINGNLGISGGGGIDTLTVNDAASTLPATYQVTNTFGAGTQNIYGIGAAGLGTSAVENLNINAGSGADTFNVDQYKSGTGFAIYGGLGDDTLNFGNNNLPLNITNLSSFLFDGQDGFDRFNLNNRTEISQWSYSANGVNVLATRGAPAGGYSAQLNGAHNEEMTVNAGPGSDTFLAPSAGPGTHTIFNGAGGVDIFQSGLAQAIQSLIKGKLTFDAGDTAIYGSFGGGSLIVSASAHTDPITAHLTARSIGAFPGDNLFGPGGSVEFLNATSLSLTLGSGADTLYVQPNATATVGIAGGSPTAVPGDMLNLALAAAQGYSVNPGSPGAGSVTSANLKALTYSGFESGPNIDDVAPAVVAADFNLNGAPLAAAGRPPVGAAPLDPGLGGPSLDIQFSEDVALLSDAASIQLTNLTTGETVPQAYIATMTYDPTTQISHHTFPGYPNGILPDGNYEGLVLAGLTNDLFGNAMAADALFDFFVLSGDANHDRSVDFNDLVVLAQNYNATGKTFSQGNFDYDPDGNVGFNDLVILAQRYNTTLPALAPPAPTGASPAPATATATAVLREDAAKRPRVFSTTQAARPVPAKPAPGRLKVVARPRSRWGRNQLGSSTVERMN
jgi:hypothetical protein